MSHCSQPSTGARLLWAAILLMASPGVAAGQTVVGTVTGGDDGLPIRGAIVHLQDGIGRSVTSGLTGTGGRFALRAPAPGSYRLTVEMIGHRSLRTEPFELEAGATVQQTLVVPIEPVALEGVTATGSRRCAPVRGSGGDLARLWDEARKGLTAVALTEVAPYVMFRTAVVERDLDLETGVVLAERVRPRLTLRGYPFRSPPAADLMEEGFIRSAGDSTIYIAPDANALLSDDFLAEYCFHVADGREPGEVGLAFRPVSRRGPVGVQGTLWLDRETAGLRALEYSYVRTTAPATAARGTLSFERLPNDAWIVREWQIRVPRRAVADHRDGIRVVSVHETTGHVVEVRGLELGPSIRIGPSVADVEGRLLTAHGELPLPGATVLLLGTGHTAITEEDGSFRWPAVSAGSYQVGWSHPGILAGETSSIGATVLVEPGASPPDLVLHAPITGAALVGCDPGPEEVDHHPAVGVIHGTVREHVTGTAMPGARVVAMDADGGVREVRSGPGGEYLFCDLPLRPYRLHANLRGAAGAEMTADLDQRPIQRLDPQVSLGPATDQPARLIGRVVDTETDAPLAGVSLRLGQDGPVRVSDAFGNFTFPAVPPGPTPVTARLLGYGDTDATLDLPGGQTIRVELRMSTRPIELEPIRVVATSAIFGAGRLAEFRFRTERGWGRFVLRDEIERRAPFRTTYLVAEHGFTVSQGAIWNRRTICPPAVYIDGIPVFRDGEPGEAAAAIDLVHPNDIEGIEIYHGPATVPGEFGGSTARCGVVAIWTRGAAGGEW